MKLSRRSFLLATGAGVAGVAGFVGLRFAFTDPEKVIADVIFGRLGYLKLDPEGVKAFARDIVAKNLIAPGKLKVFNATSEALMPFESLGYQSAALRHGQERIVTYYFLSSDFFLSGADETRTVNYLGFYDPFKAACFNPFPRTVADDAA